MGYAVVHMMKIKSSGTRGMQSHNNREHPPKTNPDIDFSKTKDNYDIIYQNNYSHYIKGAIENLATETKTVRKDAVVCCNFIVTSDEKTMKSMSPEKQRAFFEDTTQWFADRYGIENIVNATVHMDETTPHIHIGVVPIVNQRLAAKTLFDKKEMTAIQTDFPKQVGERYGLERGKEGSTRTHLSEQRFKLETAKLELEKMTEKTAQVEERGQAILETAQKVTEEVKQNTESIKTLQEQKQALQGQIKALSMEIDTRELNINEIDRIVPYKTITGTLKGVTIEDIENLKATAKNGLQAQYKYNSLASEYNHLKGLVPSLDERVKQGRDKQRLEQLEKVFEALPENIKNKLFPQKEKIQSIEKSR